MRYLNVKTSKNIFMAVDKENVLSESSIDSYIYKILSPINIEIDGGEGKKNCLSVYYVPRIKEDLRSGDINHILSSIDMNTEKLYDFLYKSSLGYLGIDIIPFKNNIVFIDNLNASSEIQFIINVLERVLKEMEYDIDCVVFSKKLKTEDSELKSIGFNEEMEGFYIRCAS